MHSKVNRSIRLGVLLVTSLCLFAACPSRSAIAEEGDVASQLETQSMSEADMAEENVSNGIAAQSLDSSTRVSSVTGVAIGTGFHAVGRVEVDQPSVYSKALQALTRWRRDALNDSRVKVEYSGSYVTVSDYLARAGISRDEYLSPHWSNALERIALQRAIEAGDVNLAHARPDGTMCFTATYGGVSTQSELLAWGESNIASAIDDWASEKEDWIKHTNGESSDQYGHYETLIDPSYRSYGFAQAPSPSMYGTVFSGEASTTVFSDESSTGISGSHVFDVSLNLRWLGYAIDHTIEPEGLLVGKPVDYWVSPRYLNHRYFLKGTIETDNASLVTVENTNRLVPHSAGTVRITMTDDLGTPIYDDVDVRFFSDVTADADHSDDINWLGNEGISTGFDRQDGTHEYRPYATVTRCDMAAFLYRLAGSPSYEEPAHSPFSDVDTNTPHYREICWLADSGVSRGFSDGTFRPYATVVRQDMAAFLRRLSAWAGHDISSAESSPFADVADGDETNHASDICWLASEGVTKGFPDGTFRGMGDVARCDMAAFLHRMSSANLS